MELTNVSQHDRIVIVLMLTGFALCAGVCLWLYWRERQRARALRARLGRIFLAAEESEAYFVDPSVRLIPTELVTIESHEKEKSDAAR